jgi:tellurite resistance protein TerC
MPISNHIDEEHFFVKTYITATTHYLLHLWLLSNGCCFAIDSVPAILAITNDPFLVFSSNIFAILGLRSMYFFLANMLAKFSYLEYSLIAILSFVGLKMLLHDFIEMPEWVSLALLRYLLLLGFSFS